MQISSQIDYIYINGIWQMFLFRATYIYLIYTIWMIWALLKGFEWPFNNLFYDPLIPTCSLALPKSHNSYEKANVLLLTQFR